MKFAYLIMIHESSFNLRRLLELIDDERNDIYIHIDAKTKIDFQSELAVLVRKSQLFFIKKRIRVYWANISQVAAEYALFEAAYNERYSYYHLLSGGDLPIKSQDYIHTFFNNNYGKEFIGFAPDSCSSRVRNIHLFNKNFRSNFFLYRLLRDAYVKFQITLRYILRSQEAYETKKGPNWVSITHDFVGCMLEKKDHILRSMRYSKSPDEHYKQTLAFNSSFRDNVYSYEDEYEGCMRLIDWHRGNPYHWRNDDFAEIVSSNKLFARKFDEKSSKLVDRLFSYIKSQSL